MSSRGSGGGRGGGGFGVERLGELVEFVRARWLLPGEYRVTITRSHRVPGIGEIHGGGKGDGIARERLGKLLRVLGRQASACELRPTHARTERSAPIRFPVQMQSSTRSADFKPHRTFLRLHFGRGFERIRDDLRRDGFGRRGDGKRTLSRRLEFYLRPVRLDVQTHAFSIPVQSFSAQIQLTF